MVGGKGGGGGDVEDIIEGFICEAVLGRVVSCTSSAPA